ncbi:MAG TPA: hypothetical protein PL029_05515 [Bacteroidia bacterium]|nr:hypothetical protein [Bacteroidia bacterium]
MKKLIVTAFCMGLALTSANLTAATQVKTTIAPNSPTDGRQIIKNEELPEPIKKTLASDTYKGWNIKEAALVTVSSTQPATPAAAKSGTTTVTAVPGATTTSTAVATTPAVTSYYEVILTKDKETNNVKFQRDGTLLK